MNMNAQDWDDHVSFSATHLAESPNGKMLAVSTDGPRIVIYRIESAVVYVRDEHVVRAPSSSSADIDVPIPPGWTQVSNIYGLPTAEFQVPCAVWLGAGACIAAAAAHGGIYFFHTGTAKVRNDSKSARLGQSTSAASPRHSHRSRRRCTTSYHTQETMYGPWTMIQTLIDWQLAALTKR